MQSRIAAIKRTLPKAEVMEKVSAPAVRLGGSGEFLRMALAAVASGVIFGVVSGLLVFLVASHQQLEPQASAASSTASSIVSTTTR